MVDKVNTGTERAEIMAESRELAAVNQAEASVLETIFTDRTRRQAQVSQLEHEIQQERQTAEKLVASMSGEMLEQYQNLRQNNERLTHQMELLQGQLDALTASRSGLQDQICLSSTFGTSFLHAFLIASSSVTIVWTVPTERLISSLIWAMVKRLSESGTVLLWPPEHWFQQSQASDAVIIPGLP
ncbi:Intraflagellar transport protein 74 [Homalodisca vitripennis]|nr:Intraflagellar transport protein 74 [Homalodisca vitripennis]